MGLQYIGDFSFSNLSEKNEKHQTQGWPDIALKHIKRLFLAFDLVILHCLKWHGSHILLKKMVPYLPASMNNVIFCPLQHFVPPHDRGEAGGDNF